jgi:hypothetical protein
MRYKLGELFIFRNIKHLVFIIICILMCSCANGSKPNAINYGAEFLGAAVGDVLIGITSASIAVHGELNDAGPLITFIGIAYLTGGLIGSPLGTALTGKITNTKGSVLGSFIGGLAGTALGVLITFTVPDQSPQEVVLPTILLLPPACSVIGYNIFPHKDNSQTMIFPAKFPALGFTVIPEKHGDKISPKIGANITFKF